MQILGEYVIDTISYAYSPKFCTKMESLPLEAGDRLLMSQRYSVRRAKRVYCSLVQ